MSNGSRILVVDDEMSLRNLIAEVLTDDGYHVTTAESGEQAMSLFLEEPFPLVITDVRMEGMSGLDLLKKLKEINMDVQVVIITSHASLESAVSALRQGAFDYLVKPFNELEDISSVAQRALEKRSEVVENRILMEELKSNNEALSEFNVELCEKVVRDGLTGLFNYRHFKENLEMEVTRSLRHKREFSLVFIDVDSFKVYNDTHGHPDGDALLINLSQLMQERLRHADLACRYGGEEFVLLLPETPKQGAAVVAENLRKLVESTPFKGGATQPFGKVSISIGVATFPEDGDASSVLMERVDRALYEAKKGGRNRVVLASR